MYGEGLPNTPECKMPTYTPPHDRQQTPGNNAAQMVSESLRLIAKSMLVPSPSFYTSNLLVHVLELSVHLFLLLQEQKRKNGMRSHTDEARYPALEHPAETLCFHNLGNVFDDA